MLIIVGLFSCADYENTFEPTQNKEGESLTITIKISDDLSKDAWEWEQGLTGQALYSKGNNTCEVVVASQLPLKKRQEVLGHEIMHCLYGDYHK